VCIIFALVFLCVRVVCLHSWTHALSLSLSLSLSLFFLLHSFLSRTYPIPTTRLQADTDYGDHTLLGGLALFLMATYQVKHTSPGLKKWSSEDEVALPRAELVLFKNLWALGLFSDLQYPTRLMLDRINSRRPRKKYIQRQTNQNSTVHFSLNASPAF
jgi:hypothetical protein